MGIRLRKQLCYALTDIKYDKKKNKIIDERISDTFKDTSDEAYENIYCRKQFDKFLKWIYDNKNGLCLELKKQVNDPSDSLDYTLAMSLKNKFEPGSITNSSYKDRNPNDFFASHWDIFINCQEFGLRNVMGFSSVTDRDWKRTGDLIDSYDIDINKPQKPRIKEIDCGIYPYVGMIKKPHDLIKDIPVPEMNMSIGKDAQLLAPAIFQMYTGRWDKNHSPMAGYDVADYLLKTYRCSMPDSILFYTYYYGVFKDWAKTVVELKPILYTYWT